MLVGSEYDRLVEHLNDFGLPFRAHTDAIQFPESLNRGTIMEALNQFYDGIAEIRIGSDSMSPREPNQAWEVTPTSRRTST